MSCPRDFLNHERLWIGVKYVCVLFRHNTSYRKYIRSITSLFNELCIVEFVILREMAFGAEASAVKFFLRNSE